MATDPTDSRRRQRNLRTALLLASIAGAFFLGVIAKYKLFG
jgi:hypothetical protein